MLTAYSPREPVERMSGSDRMLWLEFAYQEYLAEYRERLRDVTAKHRLAELAKVLEALNLALDDARRGGAHALDALRGVK